MPNSFGDFCRELFGRAVCDRTVHSQRGAVHSLSAFDDPWPSLPPSKWRQATASAFLSEGAPDATRGHEEASSADALISSPVGYRRARTGPLRTVGGAFFETSRSVSVFSAFDARNGRHRSPGTVALTAVTTAFPEKIRGAPHELIGPSNAGDEPAPPEDEDDAELVWQNTEGLPTVTVTAPSQAYFSKDMADSPGEATFRPTLGCKCGNWRPAPSHPTIEFRKEFLQQHPTFKATVDKIRVHMEDITKQSVHWDAEYDIRRFMSKDPKMKDRLVLKETFPAVPGSGKQVRFMTFCPADGPHTYKLRVTGLDREGAVIPYLSEVESTYEATPPAEEATPLADEAETGGTAETAEMKQEEE
eukprot:TRINITY_DN75505_c0_g1_i1.p1 TRINITY_DN75505_c0_g1~~TRINITY_DN75505_c0_g1_i1.p1  ORF type:complete len:360 (-),score=51.82 TRINITY_DN75505_c0_g1_i1:75-1154(-)